MTSLTPADVERLTRAIASGVRTVQYAQRTVVYHSIDDMKKALAAAESERAMQAALRFGSGG